MSNVIDKYECDECGGHGESDCCECGQKVTCDGCDGLGLDPSKLDVKAFKAACQKAFGRGMWQGFIVDGERIGRTNGKVNVLYASFTPPEEDPTYGVAIGGHKSLLEDLP